MAVVYVLTLDLGHGLRRWYVGQMLKSGSVVDNRQVSAVPAGPPAGKGRQNRHQAGGADEKRRFRECGVSDVAIASVRMARRSVTQDCCGRRNMLTRLSLDAREKEVGTANRENMSHLLSSLAIYPFTERLNMSITEVQVLLAQARREAQNPSFKAYFPVYVMLCNVC